MFQVVRVNDCLCGAVGGTGLQYRVGWLKADVPPLILVAIVLESLNVQALPLVGMKPIRKTKRARRMYSDQDNGPCDRCFTFYLRLGLVVHWYLRGAMCGGTSAEPHDDPTYP